MPTTYTATPATIDSSGTVQITNPADGDALTAASNNTGINGLANIVKAAIDKLFATTVLRYYVLPTTGMVIDTAVKGFDDEPSGGNVQIVSTGSGSGIGFVRLPRNATISTFEVLCMNKDSVSRDLTVSLAKYTNPVVTVSTSGLTRTDIQTSSTLTVAAGSGTENWGWRSVGLTSPGALTDEEFLIARIVPPNLSNNNVRVAAIRVRYSIKGVEIG